MGRLTQILTKINNEADDWPAGHDQDVESALLDQLDKMKSEFAPADFKALRNHIKGSTYRKMPKSLQAEIRMLADILKIKTKGADEAADDEDDIGIDAYKRQIADAVGELLPEIENLISDKVAEMDIPEDDRLDVKIELLDQLLKDL